MKQTFILFIFNLILLFLFIIYIKSDTGSISYQTINVYTANGDLMATYAGEINVNQADGYVKFDYEGKRYIYYNCFVETIADIQ